MKKTFLPKIGAILLLLCFIRRDVQSATITVNGISNEIGCSFNNNTCSPVGCSYVSNSACVPTSTVTDASIISKISGTTCNSTCSASTKTKCTASQIASVFAKGIASGGIKAVYCTDTYMIIQSNGMPNHAHTLAYVPRPPGGGGSGGYGTQCVTRTQVTQSFTWKIPLNPVALSTSSATVNNIAVFSVLGNKLSTAALPDNGPTGVTVTGLPIFPPYNNVGGLTWLSCEVDGCNTHAGQGHDYHYHGDPFGSNCMYSASDYSSTTAHPPVIGYALDGFQIYGRYLDTTAPGYSTSLDDCGGHIHDSYEYHYHSQVLSQTVSSTSNGLKSGQTYSAHLNGPYKCWKGDLSLNPDQWSKNGLTSQCCNTNTATQTYLASGVSLKTSSSSG